MTNLQVNAVPDRSGTGGGQVLSRDLSPVPPLERGQNCPNGEIGYATSPRGIRMTWNINTVVKPAEPKTCPQCNGSGLKYVDGSKPRCSNYTTRVKCPRCLGAKVVQVEPVEGRCASCETDLTFIWDGPGHDVVHLPVCSGCGAATCTDCWHVMTLIDPRQVMHPNCGPRRAS